MLRSASWLSLDKYGGQLLGLFFSLWVMSFSDANVFGEFAVILAWFALGNLLSESAFTITLIRYSEDDFNSSYITLALIQILIALIYSTALVVSNTGLEYYLIVPVILLQPLQVFYTVYLSRKELWSFQGKAGILANLVALVISLVLVLKGYILMGLVVRLLLRQFLLSVIGGILLISYFNKLEVTVSIRRFKSQLRYSVKILIQGMVTSSTELLFAQHMRVLSLPDLGLYNRSRQFSDFLFRTPTIIFERIAFLETRLGNFKKFLTIWFKPVVLLGLLSSLILLFVSILEVTTIVEKFFPGWGELGNLVWFIVVLGFISSITTILNSWFNSCGKPGVNVSASLCKLASLMIVIHMFSWEYVVLLSSGLEMVFLILIMTFNNVSSNSNNLV